MSSSRSDTSAATASGSCKPMVKVKKIDGVFFANKKKLSGRTGGWAAELNRLKDQATLNPTDVDVILDVAQVAFKMRQFKKSKVSARLSLSLEPTPTQKKLADKVLRKVQREVSIWPSKIVQQQPYQETRKLIKDGQFDIDKNTCHTLSVGLANLNFLQYVSLRGDVPAFEDLVSLGAAIDMPAQEEEDDKTRGVNVPRSSTLALCCMTLAFHARVEAMCIGAPVDRNIPGIVEIAVRLVRLGADVHAVLEAPTTYDEGGMMQCVGSMGLFGKTTFELAKMTKHARLIQTMKHFYKLESVMDEVECRCGSRMPWVECHAGNGTAAFCQEDSDTGKLMWRYSPLARCPCEKTSNEYYNCCWNVPRATFQNDATATLSRSAYCLTTDPKLIDAFDRMEQLRLSSQSVEGGVKCDLLFPARDEQGRSLGRAMTSDEYKAHQVQFIRRGGHNATERAFPGSPKSKQREWDPEVHACILERLETFFHWNDVHWGSSKPDLLLNVKEWNEALEKYCNDTRLHGAERMAILLKYTASPFAPCGNPNCQEMEKEIKQFKRCARCKKIAYCSKDCQLQHRKSHKPECFPI